MAATPDASHQLTIKSKGRKQKSESTSRETLHLFFADIKLFPKITPFPPSAPHFPNKCLFPSHYSVTGPPLTARKSGNASIYCFSLSKWMTECFSGVWSSPEALLPFLPFPIVPLSFCNHTAWWLRVWALVLTAWTAQLVLPLINLYANDRFLRLSVPPLPKIGTTMIIIISISQGYYED